MRSLNLMLSLISLISATSKSTDSADIAKNTDGAEERESSFHSADEETIEDQQKKIIDDLTDKLKKQEDSIKGLVPCIEKIESLVGGISSTASGFPFSFSILFTVGCVLSFFASRYLCIKDRE